MYPIIAKIGILHVYSYGLMVAIGFSIATLLAYKHAGEFGLDRERIIDFGIVILIGGIIGARIFYVILNLKYYITRPLEIINITRGGLVWYGAFISGILIAIWFVKKNKIDFWNASDLYAPYIALAQAIGRIGCFLNGCCYGSVVPSDFLISVVFPNESVWRHPTQLYSSMTLLLIFIILRRWQRVRHFKGEIFLGYILFYSVTRFMLEFIRGDNAKLLYGLTVSQLISIVISAVCLTTFIYRFLKWKKSSRSA